MNTVTVTIPAVPEESLSKAAIRRGARAKRGWIRHVTSVDRTKSGGYAFEGPEAFLRAGEKLLPVGAVIMIADHDETARLTVVAYDGALVPAERNDDGTLVWHRYKTATISTCNAAEKAMALTQVDLLTNEVRAFEAKIAAADAKLASAENDYRREQATEAKAEATAKRDEAAARLEALPAEYRFDAAVDPELPPAVPADATIAIRVDAERERAHGKGVIVVELREGGKVTEIKGFPLGSDEEISACDYARGYRDALIACGRGTFAIVDET